jgi:hypothetical protein
VSNDNTEPDPRADLALALGLLRMLTLLQLHDPSLREIEELVARAYRSLCRERPDPNSFFEFPEVDR